MTLYGFAVGLTAVVVIVAGALAIQALWLVRQTRRLKREVEEQRTRLVAQLDADLEEWARRTGYVSQVTGRVSGSPPPR